MPAENAAPLHFNSMHPQSALSQFRLLLQRNFRTYWRSPPCVCLPSLPAPHLCAQPQLILLRLEQPVMCPVVYVCPVVCAPHDQVGEWRHPARRYNGVRYFSTTIIGILLGSIFWQIGDKTCEISKLPLCPPFLLATPLHRCGFSCRGRS